jgi:hypothetical protein
MNKTCELCGKKLGSTNEIGVCHSNATCRSEYYRLRDVIRFGPMPTCDNCGRSIKRNNKVGICKVNPACKARYYREHDRLRIRGDGGKRRTKRQQFTEATRHDELTYLMYSPGLNTHKIGITTNLRIRTTNLRNGCWDIETVTTFPYGRKLEKWLHYYFHDKRIQGTEWFTDLTEVDVKNAVAEYEMSVAA